jgi:hypothetical protein
MALLECIIPAHCIVKERDAYWNLIRMVFGKIRSYLVDHCQKLSIHRYVIWLLPDNYATVKPPDNIYYTETNTNLKTN